MATNTGKAWLTGHNDYLRRAHSDGESLENLACYLGRTVLAIRYQLDKLGLKPRARFDGVDENQCGKYLHDRRFKEPPAAPYGGKLHENTIQSLKGAWMMPFDEIASNDRNTWEKIYLSKPESPTPVNHGKPWSCYHIDMLRRFCQERRHVLLVAENLGRCPSAVILKAAKGGLDVTRFGVIIKMAHGTDKTTYEWRSFDRETTYRFHRTPDGCSEIEAIEDLERADANDLKGAWRNAYPKIKDFWAEGTQPKQSNGDVAGLDALIAAPLKGTIAHVEPRTYWLNREGVQMFPGTNSNAAPKTATQAMIEADFNSIEARIQPALDVMRQHVQKQMVETMLYGKSVDIGMANAIRGACNQATRDLRPMGKIHCEEQLAKVEFEIHEHARRASPVPPHLYERQQHWRDHLRIAMAESNQPLMYMGTPIHFDEYAPAPTFSALCPPPRARFGTDWSNEPSRTGRWQGDEVNGQNLVKEDAAMNRKFFETRQQIVVNGSVHDVETVKREAEHFARAIQSEDNAIKSLEGITTPTAALKRQIKERRANLAEFVAFVDSLEPSDTEAK